MVLARSGTGHGEKVGVGLRFFGERAIIYESGGLKGGNKLTFLGKPLNFTRPRTAYKSPRQERPESVLQAREVFPYSAVTQHNNVSSPLGGH